MRVINKWDTFNQWTVSEEIERKISNTGRKIRMFLCICSCWETKVLEFASLVYWRSKSCWCSYIHWLSKSAENNTWSMMKDRCYNVSSTSYNNYWWRWIIVCDRWKDSFENFYKDMWPKPIKEWIRYSLDRIDNNWNYCKENCRWATYKEQCNNKRSNIRHEWLTISQRANKLWIRYWTFWHKLKTELYDRDKTIQFYS